MKKTWEPSPNFTKGSDTASIKDWWGKYGHSKRTFKYICIHWWDAPERKPKFENVVAVLRNEERQASAHYVAEAGRVAQLVREEDIAWANNGGNPETISIECNPRQTDADYDTVAKLIADIWKRRGVLPLVKHSRYSNTQCPGTYDLNRLKKLAEKHYSGYRESEYRVRTKMRDAKTYTAMKSPTILWDFSGKTWKDFKPVKKFKQGTKIDISAYVDHEVGSRYFMTEYSYKRNLSHGFNAVDLKEEKPAPKQPSETKRPKKTTPKEKPGGDTISGGDRKSIDATLKRHQRYFDLLFSILGKLWSFVGQVLNEKKKIDKEN